MIQEFLELSPFWQVVIGVVMAVFVGSGLSDVIERHRYDRRKQADASRRMRDCMTQIADNCTRSSGPWSLTLPLDGKEVVTPYKLVPDRRYRIELSGRYEYRYQYWSGEQGDAFYVGDACGNFRQPVAPSGSCNGLYLDNQEVASWRDRQEVVTEEPHRNFYALEIDGTGDYLAVSFRPPGAAARPLGPGLVASIALEPKDVPLLTTAAETALVLEQTTERGQELDRKVQTLIVMSEGLRNWSSPKFRKDSARKYLRNLLAKRSEILAEYFSFYKDPECLARLKTEHPKVWARLSGKFEALIVAERLDVAPPSKKQRITTDEFRRRMIRRLVVAAGDQEAILETALHTYESKRAKLVAVDCDDDVIDEILGTPGEAVEQAMVRQEQGKGGRNEKQTITMD